MPADTEAFDAWDPLEATQGLDPGLLISAQRREISNILRSYTGYYDVFAELLQNALDAVERRMREGEEYKGHIYVEIDLSLNSVRVIDNGCGMDLQQFKQFLRPNLSFKSGEGSRGNKGVGATYLGYGFNHLQVSSRQNGKTYSGLIEHGRSWVDDKTGTIPRPRINSMADVDPTFSALERGTSIEVRLIGNNIRPRNLSWYQAQTAEQWVALLRILTPLGGIYLESEQAPDVEVQVKVTSATGTVTNASVSKPEYLYPHGLISRSGSIVEFLKHQQATINKGGDASIVPARFKGLNGLWGSWTSEQLLGDSDRNYCPVNLSLDSDERDLARTAGVAIYVYLAFSTDLWDTLNDSQLKLRKGARVLHGGLQLATRHMPQGLPLTIPMTNNVGFQNLAHIIIHFKNAEPDLGRKGFQPEYAHLAEKIAVSAVTAFRRRYNLLRKPGVAKIFSDELRVDNWIRSQEEHEKEHALAISGKGLFSLQKNCRSGPSRLSSRTWLRCSTRCSRQV